MPYDGEEYDDNDEDNSDIEETELPSTEKENLDRVEIELQNVQLGEEESHPKMPCILLIPSGSQVTSPFDRIDVGLDEVMQNHPRIIDTIIIRITIIFNINYHHRTNPYHIHLYIHTNNYNNYQNS